ncbi:MAG: YciI family protein [Chloroflexi bacterium]|nr:YciI family protein [Chloroflexota bacterium]
MPKYAALLYQDEHNQPAQGSPEMAQVYQAWGAFNEKMKDAAALAPTTQITHILGGTMGLSPTSTATTVRVRDGKTMTTDGPFAETREQLSGVFYMECKDLDEAIEWASQIPYALYGSVEIRPLWTGSY